MPTDYTLEMDADIAAALRRQEEIEAEGYDRPMISLRWRAVAALRAAWEAAEDEERELRGYADRAAEQIEALIAERDAALARAERAEATIAALGSWIHIYGAELCPTGPDTYGEGVRASKARVAQILRSQVPSTAGGGSPLLGGEGPGPCEPAASKLIKPPLPKWVTHPPGRAPLTPEEEEVVRKELAALLGEVPDVR